MKIIAEYINAVCEEKNNLRHIQLEKIVRGSNCQYLILPKLDNEPILCGLLGQEVTPNCYCCWAKKKI